MKKKRPRGVDTTLVVSREVRDGEVSTPRNTIPDPISSSLACRVVKPNFELSCKLMFEREIVNRRHGMPRHSDVHRALGDSWALTGIADG